MSMATDPAYPSPVLRNRTDDVYQNPHPGLTIRDLAALHIFAVAINTTGGPPTTVDARLDASFKSADAYCARLDLIAKGGK